MTTTTGRDAPTGRPFISVRKISAVALILFVLALALELLNNNLRFTDSSKSQFAATLDNALARSAAWAAKQYQPTASGTLTTPAGDELVSNAPLAHMIVDCATVASDPGIKELGSSFVEAWHANPSVLGKLVDPSKPIKPPTFQELQTFDEYQRWILHGAAPDAAPLSSQELQDMFNPNRYRTGSATHQLLALYFYRKSVGSTKELDSLMNSVEHRIASEAVFDFRVTDLYLQRIAFLLAAGRPDLVRSRWVERALAAQQPDGGWLKNWHGWTRTPYRFKFDDRSSNAHSTAQGLWITCMLKYRYPEWTERNYE